MKLRRFIYVAGLRSKVRHILFGRAKVEGIAACGIVVSKGWFWWASEKSHKMPICKNCLRVPS